MTYVAAWLLYLWPAGPPEQIATNLTGFSSDDSPMISQMLLIWRTRGVEGSINKIIALQQKPDAETATAVWRLTIELFANSLFYLPKQAGLVLEENKIDSHHKSSKVLESIDNYWPLELRYLHLEEQEISFQVDNYFLIYPAKNDSYWYAIWKICQINLNMPCTMWARGSEAGPVTLRLHFNKLIVALDCTKRTLTTPAGEVYQLALSRYPPCMRPWVQHYKSCLALPLCRETPRGTDWFLFMCGQNDRWLQKSIFDERDVQSDQSVLITEPVWYIYKMHPIGSILPVIDRYTVGWYFLLQQLIDSVKQSCLELIRPSVLCITKDMTTEDERKYPLAVLSWPSPRSHTEKQEREVYATYLRYRTLQDITTSDLQDQVWRILSTSVSALPIQEMSSVLMKILYAQAGLPYTPYAASALSEARQLFEIAAGKIMREQDQVPLLQAARDNIDGTPTIRLALMGIGKSSVLIPAVTVSCLRLRQRVTIIQPSHLVPQTLALFDQIMPLIFQFQEAPYRVMSDTQAKREYLRARKKGIRFDNQHVVLFDEIDSMYNCFRSEYNQPLGDTIKHPLFTTLPMDQYYQLIVDLTYNKGEPSEEQKAYWSKHHPKFLAKLLADINLIKRSMRFQLTFGCVPGNLLAIPFSAVNKPAIGSNFTDIDITALLTCLVRKKNGLSKEDFYFLKNQLHHLHQRFGSISLVPEDLFTLSPDEMMQKYRKDTELSKFYLACILLPDKLRCHAKQFNISFIDLMDSHFAEKRIGFSGTKLMIVPRFAEKNWQSEIVPDLAAESNIYQNIVRGDNMLPYSLDSFWDQLSQKKFDVLIDAGALLRKYGAAIDVVKKWAEMEKDPVFVYVYIDSLHQAREYTPSSTEQAMYRFDASKKYRWYFDQQHTVGIDLPVSETAVGLTLINGKSRLTDVAQAIYRLRNLGEGKQSIQLFMMKGKYSQTRAELYNLLKKNDDQFLLDVRGRHYLQTAKTVFRSECKHVKKCYHEKVKYYMDDVEFPDSQTELCKQLVADAKQYLSRTVSEIDLQQEQEQEQEQSVLFRGDRVTCFENTKLVEASIESYMDSSWGIPITLLSIHISPEAARGVSTQENALCVIYTERFHQANCKIITLAEMLLIQSRGGLSADFQFVYRFQQNVPVEKYELLLALALCGRPLALHEQLAVIKNTDDDKDMLRKLFNCFDVLDALHSEILDDYFNSTFTNAEYISSFAQDYDTFVKKWISIPIPKTKMLPYFEECMRIIKSPENMKIDLITDMY